MAEQSSFDDLMGRVRAGDRDAATAVFNRFARRLIGLARSRLGPLLRKEDPEDVLQSVFKSFFLRYAEGQWDLSSWDSLWSLLTVLTVRKCGHRIEYFGAACRDVHREAAPAASPQDSSSGWALMARDPTPEEAAMLAELVQQLMNGMQERERQILALSLHGFGAPEISERVGCTERTVYRVLERVRKQLEKAQAESISESA